MTTRRDFLGQTLGVFVTSGLPFQISKPQSKIKDKYSLILITDKGKIQGPPIKRIEESIATKLGIIFEPLEIRTRFQLKEVMLLDSKKSCIFKSPYLHFFENGDVFNLQYNVEVS